MRYGLDYTEQPAHDVNCTSELYQQMQHPTVVPMKGLIVSVDPERVTCCYEIRVLVFQLWINFHNPLLVFSQSVHSISSIRLNLRIFASHVEQSYV